jgi:hypothetical protein
LLTRSHLPLTATLISRANIAENFQPLSYTPQKLSKSGFFAPWSIEQWRRAMANKPFIAKKLQLSR